MLPHTPHYQPLLSSSLCHSFFYLKMTTQSSFHMENPKKTHHRYINYQKAKDISLFAFVFSIVVYISISYDILNLSPSTLLHNTKFLFLIFNTLIIIIAADYGAFSSSKHGKPDLYDQYCYALRSQASASSFVSQQYEETIVNKSSNIPMEEKIIKEVKDVAGDHKKIGTKTMQRSKSNKVKHVTFYDNNKNSNKNNIDSQRYSKTEKHEPNEFSSMSDEELNRRVEEFIEKFNRQIRLQAITTK